MSFVWSLVFFFVFELILFCFVLGGVLGLFCSAGCLEFCSSLLCFVSCLTFFLSLNYFVLFCFV